MGWNNERSVSMECEREEITREVLGLNMKRIE